MMQIEQEQQWMRDRLERALTLARQAGVSAEVVAYQDQGLSATVRKQDVDTVEFTRNFGLGITVYRQQCKGSASTSDLSDASVSRCVQAALDIARYTAVDPCSGLAEASLMPESWPDLDLYHPWSTTTEELIELAMRCEQAGLSQSVISNSDGASMSTLTSIRAYGNTHGLLVVYPQTRHACGCALIAKQHDSMERGGWSYSHRVAAHLPEPESIGLKAADRAQRRLNSRSVPTGKYPVLFSAEIASGLVGHAISAISGGNLYRHASFLEGCLGQTLFPEWLTIEEQPRLPQGAASAPVDADGLATENKVFVDQGVLASYLLGTYSARKLGMASTANAGGVRNVRCTSTAAFSDLLTTMGSGLWVTEVMGQGVNIVTGNYSRGAVGFWVENGQVQFPVSEVTVAGNLRDMFRNIQAVGDDVDDRGNIQIGSVLLDSMTVGGKPQ